MPCDLPEAFELWTPAAVVVEKDSAAEVDRTLTRWTQTVDLEIFFFASFNPRNLAYDHLGDQSIFFMLLVS